MELESQCCPADFDVDVLIANLPEFRQMGEIEEVAVESRLPDLSSATVPAAHALVVLDIANGAKPVEVSRLTISETFKPHWTGWDAKDTALGRHWQRASPFLMKLDQVTGAIAMDVTFQDADGKPGFNFAEREWRHGWKGSGLPHRVVFSR